LRSRVARDVALVVLVHLAVAVAIGLLVPHLADLPQVVRTADGISSTEVEVTKRFDDDGWLIVLGVVAGLLLGWVLQRWRGTHEVVTLLAIALAAFLGALLAGWVAEATGPADAAAVLADASVGTTATMPVVIDSRVAYLVWPLASVLGALAALVKPISAGPTGTEVPADASNRDVP